MRLLLIVLVASVSSCARPLASTTPSPRELEEMRITARSDGAGGYEFHSYDAEGLFREGVRRSQEGRCGDGLPFYERVTREFPSSRFVSPSLYNAALCLKSEAPNEAALRFERILRDLPDSPDRTHSAFQLLEVYLALEQWDDGIAVADRLLRSEGLSPDERVEAMARRAQHLLAASRIAEATSQAETTLAYVRTRREPDHVRDTQFIAAANYVLGETIRLRASAMELPAGGVRVQRPVLEARARMLLEAQRTYFDTIRRSHPYWASAAGYRMGAMYDALWEEIMRAPVPPPSEDIPARQHELYADEYRHALARLIKPLLRHSIRYWELTLLMVERTGVNSEWTERIRHDLERVRRRLLEQPEGLEGIDAAGRIAADTRRRLEERAEEPSSEPTEVTSETGNSGAGRHPSTEPFSP